MRGHQQGGRRSGGSGGRRPGRSLIRLIFLLPALLCAQVLGGTAVWLHSHGLSGDHLHLEVEPLEHDHHAALHDWHATRDRLEQVPAGEAHDGEEHAPAGLVIDLPDILATPRGGPGFVSGPDVHPVMLLAAPGWQHAVAIDRHGPQRAFLDPPPRRVVRMGVAALLLSSHAILI